ncbi:5'-deoxynucleotidase [Azotobacter beijerinckii]|uniref:5'-deoxynucleotidase n=2 Tax=Azotobacter beijerinckii TaxID=170623 RepID=A0A1H6YEZ6_9GAMM|nr:5'-deoxynucleotidase [Azotobacter beijerinckii]
MITFVTDRRPGEPCIIQGHEQAPLVIKTMEGDELLRLAPTQPWTHERLVSLPLQELLGEALEGGADAYLGEQWVGSTEV